MVPRLLGGLVVVIAVLVLTVSALLLAWDGSRAEGPYRKRENCRCVCK
jgi:hypothetical protein